MAYVAKQDGKMLVILQDDEPQNPRTEWDNNATMVCWHSRYNLGDEHEFSDPNEFLMDLVSNSFSDDEIIEHIKSGKLENYRLTFQDADNEWRLEGRYKENEKWGCINYFNSELEEIKDEISESIIKDMSNNELMTLVKKRNEILPLYLFDHSGITMNTTGFSCPWDSGQVGYIYRSHQEIKEKFDGDISEERLKSVRKYMVHEVSTYDWYLTGETYGYKYFEEGAETDSCWGFYGVVKDLKGPISEFLPEESQYLINHLEYVGEDEIKEYEQEYEEEFEMEARV